MRQTADRLAETLGMYVVPDCPCDSAFGVHYSHSICRGDGCGDWQHVFFDFAFASDRSEANPHSGSVAEYRMGRIDDSNRGVEVATGGKRRPLHLHRDSDFDVPPEELAAWKRDFFGAHAQSGQDAS